MYNAENNNSELSISETKSSPLQLTKSDAADKQETVILRLREESKHVNNTDSVNQDNNHIAKTEMDIGHSLNTDKVSLKRPDSTSEDAFKRKVEEFRGNTHISSSNVSFSRRKEMFGKPLTVISLRTWILLMHIHTHCTVRFDNAETKIQTNQEGEFM